MFLYGELSVVISAMAVWMDLKDASVDNGWILFSFMIGFLIQITENGPKGGVIFLAGVAVPVLLLGILFIFHMIGAGDIKLLCALGGIMGPRTVMECIVYSLLAGAGISLILDMGENGDEDFRLLEMCRKIYMPVLNDTLSVCKVTQFENLLRIWNKEKILEKTEKVHLPFHMDRISSDAYVEQLVWSELGDYIRELLRKERS